MTMRLLILEDDVNEIKKIEKVVNASNNFEIIDAVSSVGDALIYIDKMKIDGIIVDIELNKGLGGSGLDFLKAINERNLDFKPLIFVTTRNESEAVYNACRALNVDMVYYKSKEDYSSEMLLNQFLILKPYVTVQKNRSKKSKIETEIEKKKRIEEILTEEFNYIGLPPQMKGYKYAFEAIMYLIDKTDTEDLYYTNYLYEKFKVRKGGISTSIQDAINSAWRNTPDDDILEHFTANISYNKGAPTPTQFIHYYVEKVKKEI